MAPQFLLTLLSATMIAVRAGGQLGHAAPEATTAEVFWRAVLPDSPLPEAILRLLGAPGGDHHGETSFVEKAEVNKVFHYLYRAPSNAYTSYSDDNRFSTYNYKAPSKNHRGSRGSEGESTARGGGAATTTVFFREEAVRVGERLPFHFPPAATSALGFLPRHVAGSVSFTKSALPGVIALFGIAPGSAEAAVMEDTLRRCESPALAGESKFCATSLETLVERAMDVLGTRDVKPITSMLHRAGAPLQTYTVTAVRPVEGGQQSFVACHDEAFPYAVYLCHTTGPARAYMVEMEGAGDGGAVTVATVCHTDTSMWNPEHVAFKLLGTKPGGDPVCHLMPYGHMIWAKNVKRSSA